MLSTVYPNLGGYLGLGKLAVANHASMRAEDLYYTRRKIAGNYQLDFSFEKKSRLSSLLLAIGYFSLNRRFNDFNRRDSQFEEDGDLLQLLARWQRQFARGTLALDLVVNAGGRDRLFAENGRYPQETYRQDKRSWLAAADWAGRPCHLKFSWLQEWQERRPAVEDAGKDLKDIDGQGFFPFEKWGRFSATTLALAADKTFALTWLGEKTVIEPYLDLSAVFLSAAEKTGALNEIYFAGKPYLALQWQGGGDYRNQRRTAAAGTRFEMELEPEPLLRRPGVLAVPGPRFPHRGATTAASCSRAARPASPCSPGKGPGSPCPTATCLMTWAPASPIFSRTSVPATIFITGTTATATGASSPMSRGAVTDAAAAPPSRPATT